MTYQMKPLERYKYLLELLEAHKRKMVETEVQIRFMSRKSFELKGNAMFARELAAQKEALKNIPEGIDIVLDELFQLYEKYEEVRAKHDNPKN